MHGIDYSIRKCHSGKRATIFNLLTFCSPFFLLVKNSKLFPPSFLPLLLVVKSFFSVQKPALIHRTHHRDRQTSKERAPNPSITDAQTKNVIFLFSPLISICLNPRVHNAPEERDPLLKGPFFARGLRGQFRVWQDNKWPFYIVVFVREKGEFLFALALHLQCAE